MGVASGGDASGDGAISVNTSALSPDNATDQDLSLPLTKPKEVSLYDRARETSQRIRERVNKFFEEFTFQHIEY